MLLIEVSHHVEIRDFMAERELSWRADAVRYHSVPKYKVLSFHINEQNVFIFSNRVVGALLIEASHHREHFLSTIVV